jgi:integrase
MRFRVYIPHRNQGSKTRRAIYHAELRIGNEHKTVYRSLGTTDKRVADKKAEALFQELQQEAAGVPTARALTEWADKPLAGLSESFLRDLQACNRSAATVRKYGLVLAKLFKECGWTTLRNADAVGFDEWRASAGRSPKTLHDYLGVAKEFFKWLVKKGHLPKNPLENTDQVKLLDEDDFRFALTHEQLSQLFKSAPDMRAFIYRVLYYSALRRNEANQLTWDNIKLDIERPVIIVKASVGKNRKPDIIEIAPAILQELRAFRPQHWHPAARAFFGHVPKVETLRKDLLKAGIQPEDTLGRRFDLHAFRKTLGSHMAQAGVPMHITQRALRHRDIKQTTKYYTDKALLSTQGAFASIAEYWKAAQGAATGRVLEGGTDHRGISRPLLTHCDNTGYGEKPPQTPEAEPSRLVLTPVGTGEKWSGWRDSNSRPLAPHASALPGYATARQ